jgi:hypothetical protein
MLDSNLNRTPIEEKIMLKLRNIWLSASIVKEIRTNKSVRCNDYAQLQGGQVSKLIYNNLEKDKPYMISRLGHTELNLIIACLNSKKRNRHFKYLKGEMSTYKIPQRFLYNAKKQSGIFPPSRVVIEKLTELYLKDIQEIDILGSWLRDEELLNSYLTNSIRVPLNDLEPYNHEKFWTRALRNKRVLVIHPFKDSIELQYERKELVYPNGLLPNFRLTVIKAVQSVAGAETDFKDWFEALEFMKNQMDKVDFDIALIGCGAYGLPLAAHAKRIGKKSVHLGGALQILFGIIGHRWEKGKHPVIDSMVNEYWVRPSEKEVPTGYKKLENGAYW